MATYNDVLDPERESQQSVLARLSGLLVARLELAHVGGHHQHGHVRL